jgi:hypothetical protein
MPGPEGGINNGGGYNTNLLKEGLLPKTGIPEPRPAAIVAYTYKRMHNVYLNFTADIISVIRPTYVSEILTFF